MKIGIIGTRGIPNQFGGFEQFAEKFSVRMAERGHDVTVYSSQQHSYKKNEYRNVHLIHCYDPEYILGTAGQFIYDFNCIRHSRKQNYDIILQLGYTSSTIWSWLYPAQSILVTNMDGLEWSRTKYNKSTQYFLTYAEKWGVLYSDHLIADSKGIQDYLYKKFKEEAVFIPYGADIYIPQNNEEQILKLYAVSPDKYDLVIARFEPENNIEIILRSYSAQDDHKLLLIGNYSNTLFGRRMYREYEHHAHINFAGPNFDIEQLNILRYNSRLYLHGHSAGGTNPSLLEAMACNALICAHDNVFNKNILGEDAFYFDDPKDLMHLISSTPSKDKHLDWLNNNEQKILKCYNWDVVTLNIESYFKQWKSGEQFMEVPCVV